MPAHWVRRTFRTFRSRDARGRIAPPAVLRACASKTSRVESGKGGIRRSSSARRRVRRAGRRALPARTRPLRRPTKKIGDVAAERGRERRERSSSGRSASQRSAQEPERLRRVGAAAPEPRADRDRACRDGSAPAARCRARAGEHARGARARGSLAAGDRPSPAHELQAVRRPRTSRSSARSIEENRERSSWKPSGRRRSDPQLPVDLGGRLGAQEASRSGSRAWRVELQTARRRELLEVDPSRPRVGRPTRRSPRRSASPRSTRSDRNRAPATSSTPSASRGRRSRRAARRRRRSRGPAAPGAVPDAGEKPEKRLRLDHDRRELLACERAVLVDGDAAIRTVPSSVPRTGSRVESARVPESRARPCWIFAS